MRDEPRPQEPGAPRYPLPAPAPPCGCDTDPIGALRQLFVDVFQSGALARGRDPASRPVFLRLHGVAHGTLHVRPDLPDDLRVGVFAQAHEYASWIRFSSDVQPGRPDFKGTVGIAIKLFGVDGATQDFVLQNHDVFFVDTAKDMCEFTCASLNGRFDEYVRAHPITGQVLADMEKAVDSVLVTPYWSVLSSQFGAGRYVKYRPFPEGEEACETPDYNDPFYLRADLQARLRRSEARFRLSVQFQTNPGAMPLDRATVRWSETASPPIHVATLVIPMQDAGERGQSAYGENLSFSPWHTLAAHQPAGSISEARRVYAPARTTGATSTGFRWAPPPCRDHRRGSRMSRPRRRRTHASFAPRSTRRSASPGSATAPKRSSLDPRSCRRHRRLAALIEMSGTRSNGRRPSSEFSATTPPMRSWPN